MYCNKWVTKYKYTVSRQNVLYNLKIKQRFVTASIKSLKSLNLTLMPFLSFKKCIKNLGKDGNSHSHLTRLESPVHWLSL